MYKDLTGLTFGKLTVIQQVESLRHARRWLCQCSCGNTSTVSTAYLTSGNTTSCGCNKNKPKHGKAGTRIYRIYQSMLQRCYNPKHVNYNCYGGRGIKVCNEWRNSFAAFYEWASANGYSDILELDRMDVNGAYSPDNCRWISHIEQCQNRRTSVFVTINGETRTLSEWARIAKIKYNTLDWRYRNGMQGTELIMPTKKRKKGQHLHNR